MEFNRQYMIYNPKEQNLDITIIGAGSTGSFIALNLAKMGIEQIKVIDFDVVEKHNLPNQFYRLKDVGKKKVDALKEIIKDFTDVSIKVEDVKIDKDYDFDVNSNSIIICCVDSMEARKTIYDLLKGFPLRYIDTRFGGEGYSIHNLDLFNEDESDNYKKSMDAPTKETTCGSKAIIYTILSLASEVCNIVKRIDKGEESPELLRRELKVYRFIEKKSKLVKK